MDRFISRSNVIKNAGCYIGLLIYRVLLDFVYVYYISPNYSYYMGLETNIRLGYVLLSYLLMLAVLPFMTYKDEYLSDVFLNVQLIIMLIPMLSLCAMSGRSALFSTIVCLTHIMQCVIVRFSHQIIGRNNQILVSQSRRWMMVTLLLLLGISIVYTFYNYGFATLRAFDLTTVYDIRKNVGYSFPFTYLVPWTFKIVCLYLFIVSLERKKYVVAVIACLAQIYFYLIYANKSTLFSWILVLAAYVAIKKFSIIKSIIYGMIGVLAGSTLIYVTTSNIMPLSLFIRRTLFVSARIKFAYYEFFSQNGLLYFADNSIGHLFGISSSYDLEAPKLIASYLSVPDSYCNSGYWGDAFANLGWAGVFLFSFILIGIVIVIEKMDVPKEVCFPLMISMFYNLNDGALLTWILGGGGALMMMLLWLYRNDSQQVGKNETIQKDYI